MPAKRRLVKRRTERPDAPLEAWLLVFVCGHDYFDELRPYGVDPTCRETVAKAWARHRDYVLENWPAIYDSIYPGETPLPPWALTEFG